MDGGDGGREKRNGSGAYIGLRRAYIGVLMGCKDGGMVYMGDLERCNMGGWF